MHIGVFSLFSQNMNFIDTHTHIYDAAFDQDRDSVIAACKQAGVNTLLLPNINWDSIPAMLQLCSTYPRMCHPMLGLHPCDVKSDYKEVLQRMFALFGKHPFIAIGEIGIDLYWDTSMLAEQKEAFAMQVDFAVRHQLPLVIHKRQSYYEVIDVLEQFKGQKLRGIFHCWSGSIDHALAVIAMGFYLGIGGTVTYKSSHLDELLPHIDLQNIVLETDSPYLSPHPYRGQRNQSSYIPVIAKKIAEIKHTDIPTVADITTKNAKQLFKI